MFPHRRSSSLARQRRPFVLAALLVSLAIAGCSRGVDPWAGLREFPTPAFADGDSMFSDTELRAALCSDDVAIARAWAESTGVRSSDPAVVLADAPLVTERFIEFATRRANGSGGVPMRVHRASWVDCSMIDRLQYPPSSLVGVLQARPASAEHALEAAEYFYFVQHRGAGDKPLSVRVADIGGRERVTIWRLQPWRFDFTMMLDLVRSDYDVDVTTGAIVRHETTARTISLQPGDAPRPW